MAERQRIGQEYHTGADMARAELNAFIDNDGLDELTDLYGVALPDHEPARLAAAQSIAAAHWDFRKGAERQATEWDIEGELGVEGSPTWRQVFAAADKLGMVESGELRNRHPKYLAILGGANKAPLDRLRFGLGKVDSFEYVVYLGSSRKVVTAEREKAAGYAPDAQTEYDLGSGAFETLLGARLVDEITEERNGDTWGMRMYEFERGGETKTGFVLCTPQTIHDAAGAAHRATTYDNYKFFADRAELADDPDATVAAVTTGFYVPAQHMAGVQEIVLPYGVQLETVGHSADYSGVQRKPSQLLQETKAAVDAAVRLQSALGAVRQAELVAMRQETAMRFTALEDFWNSTTA